ncbi:MAG: hypothetical protein GIW97_09175 [Candidatus Eremiobacteraeota bacterium]|nr:hypothetical protein [Candidatus Eremiobacteraeota bacterium]
MSAARALSFIALLLSTPLLLGAASSSVNGDPNAVVISTSDINLFWQVVDQAHGNPGADDFKVYFEKGSLGVQGFTKDRLVNPAHLAKVFARNKSYYFKTRPNMELVPTQVGRLRDDLRRFKEFFPQAFFPNLYFVIGALNSAGTSVDGVGAIMGTEMFSKGPNIVQSDAPDDDIKVLQSIDVLAPTAAHELTHYNQNDTDTRDLLGSAIHEGSADFISQLADGNNVNPAEWSFGCAHEAALWREFQKQMYSGNGATIGNWLFSYRAGPLGAPPFIGYWLGLRIVQSYYDRRSNKQATISAIMHVRDYGAFLRDSAYPAKRPACRPEPRWKS